MPNEAGRTRPVTGWLPHLDRWDAIGMAVAALSLLIGSLVAHYRVPYFWYDELATWTLVSDPSLAHMLAAIRRGAESNPPLYESVLWGWSSIAGSTELSLRLVSVVFMISAMTVLWTAMRHGYGTAATALGIGTVFFGAQVILEQLPQARFYGLFALCAALAIAMAVEAERRDIIGGKLLAGTFVAHLALVYCHVFGGFFSAAIVTATLVTDLRSRRFRLPLYTAVVGAWVMFLPWFPAVLDQRALGEGRSWLARPTRDDLFALVGRQILWLPLAALVTVLSAALTGGEESPRRHASTDDGGGRLVLIVVGAALLAVVPAVFLLSRIAAPIFLDRYLLPSAFGWAIIVAHLAHRLDADGPQTPNPRRMRFRSGVDVASVLLFCVLAFYPVFFALARKRAARPDLALGAGFNSLPIVVESAHHFWPLRHYATARRDRYRYLLDHAVAADPDNAPGAAQERTLMELYGSEGYLRGSVEDAALFLCANPRFVVVDRPGFLWFERRVLGDPSYTWRTIGRYLDSAVHLVERTGSCAPAGSGR